MDKNVPEEKGLAFAFRMYKAYYNRLKRFFNALDDSDNKHNNTKNTWKLSGEIPKHLLRKGSRYAK